PQMSGRLTCFACRLAQALSMPIFVMRQLSKISALRLIDLKPPVTLLVCRKSYLHKIKSGSHESCRRRLSGPTSGASRYAARSRRYVPYGIGQALPGRSAASSRDCRRVLDGLNGGEEPAVS